MKIFKFTLISLAIILFIISCSTDENATSSDNSGSNGTANVSPTPEATPDELAEGRRLYKEHCARCHQEDGSGGRVEIEGKKLRVEDLTTEKMAEESDEEYIEYMVEGIPDEGMPSFKDVLTDDEMQAIVRFIRREFQNQK